MKKYTIKILDKITRKIVNRYKTTNESASKRMKEGIEINLNHNKYEVIIEKEK